MGSIGPFVVLGRVPHSYLSPRSATWASSLGIRHRRSRPRLYPLSSLRRILPTGVFGSSVRNSMNFGRL